MIKKEVIVSLIQKWKSKRATTEQKAVIRDLEQLLKEADEHRVETFSCQVNL